MLLIAGPMAIALLASTLRLYPLTARLWAFSAPLWAALVAAGVVGGARALQDWLRVVAVAPLVTAATACLMAVAGFDAAIGLASPYWRRAHIRPLIRALEEEQRSTGDPIYVMPRAAPQWLFYTSPWRADPAPVRRDSAAQWLENRTCTGRDGQHARACQMLGGYSSVTYAEVGGFAGQLDTAWAAREISRVRAAASPCAWVLMHLPYPGEPAALARAVDAQGGRVDKALEDRAHPNRDAATKAFRVCFDTLSHAP